MSQLTPPFRSAVYYSVQNEDYRPEMAILDGIRTGRPRRVLMIASSGENALSLLTDPSVDCLVAVDVNPAQIQMCELRRIAIEHLSRDDQLRLLGADDPLVAGATGAIARQLLYERVRPHLPETARAFWDERLDAEVAFGIHHIGRNDVGMHDIQDRLQEAGFAPLSRPLRDEDRSAWRAVYADLWTPAYIRTLFGLPSDALAARISSIAARLGDCHFEALRKPDADRNPYLTTALANRYASAAGEDGLPLYLQERGQAALRRLGTSGRLSLVAGNFVDQMASLTETYGPFDVISISNIADWMDHAQFSSLVQLARDCLRHGGALLARTATGDPMIVDVCRSRLRVDDSFSARLLDIERGPWFRILVAGVAA